MFRNRLYGGGKWMGFLGLFLALAAAEGCEKKPHAFVIQKSEHEKSDRSSKDEQKWAVNPHDLPVLLIGADGLDLEVIRELADAGKLPVIRAMMDGGVCGTLLSEHEMRSPPLWTTIATGRPRAVHGIYDFVTGSRLWPKELRSEKRRLVTSSMRNVDALWDIVSRRDKTVAVVGWLNTWPAEKVNGVMVSPYVALGSKKQVTIKGTVYPDVAEQVYPRKKWQEIQALVVTLEEVEKKLVGGFFPNPPEDVARSYPILRKYERGVRWSLAHTLTMRNITLHLIRQLRPDLTMVYFEGADSLAHRFWLFRRPTAEIEAQLKETGLAVSHAGELGALYGDVLNRYYMLLDETVGELISAMPKGSRVVLVSDHGFTNRSRHHPAPQTVPFTGEHRIEGVILISGLGIQTGKTIVGATIYNVVPTVLDLLGVRAKLGFEGKSLRAQVQSYRSDTRHNRNRDHVTPDSDSMLVPFDEEEIDRLRSLGYVE